MKCKKCGAEIENGLMYCPSCGESIQLVPDYNVLEEELLSKVVEDKNKSKDDKFATGVYQIQEEAPAANTPSKTQPQPKPEPKVFTKKIKAFLLVACLLVAIIGVCMFIPYMGAHTYDNIMNQAVDAESNEQYAKALGYYEEAYEIDPTSFEVIYGLGRMYYMVKDYDDAIEMLYLALDSDPTNKKIYTYLLNALYANGDMDGISALLETSPSDEITEMINSYFLSAPTFNLAGGNYEEDLLIQITVSGDYKIFYTLNGKSPITTGKQYTKPIPLTEGTTEIKAVAQNDAGEYSDIVSATYTITYPEVEEPEESTGEDVTIDVTN
ncbi:zinc-ribbon domain-containing protein [Pseudobutyrivibrio sp. C4]|uniref:FN3 associated domain-containing protein n=1 Tax=Pseudobutyrivibrio sp. C4 TaxID=1520803 RepID=UPI0008B138E6|nr:FN3 associated domain-containing protein [Pseudobutyrivibrio sp. C4]SES71709.1 zinc-ribbon domain-containing protein [Pseudobutyrivibrio sp. C4]